MDQLCFGQWGQKYGMKETSESSNVLISGRERKGIKSSYKVFHYDIYARRVIKSLGKRSLERKKGTGNL